jgi:hypothetical protein
VTKQPFWRTKKLSEFTTAEWESVCSRCGRCCLIKLQDEDSDEVYYTRIICHLFDQQNHRCLEYQNRCTLVPECLKITPENIDSITWMPKACAYRILNETGDLPDGHPLKGGTEIPPLPDDLTTDILVAEDDFEDYIIENEEF